MKYDKQRSDSQLNNISKHLNEEFAKNCITEETLLRFQCILAERIYNQDISTTSQLEEFLYNIEAFHNYNKLNNEEYKIFYLGALYGFLHLYEEIQDYCNDMEADKLRVEILKENRDIFQIIGDNPGINYEELHKKNTISKREVSKCINFELLQDVKLGNNKVYFLTGRAKDLIKQLNDTEGKYV